jgi:hypothetical protein
VVPTIAAAKAVDLRSFSTTAKLDAVVVVSLVRVLAKVVVQQI